MMLAWTKEDNSKDGQKVKGSKDIQELKIESRGGRCTECEEGNNTLFSATFLG